MAGEAAGFWSYVHRDDGGDHGRILAFAEDLREQYRIQTADELELFIDRDSIQWGEAWEQRINTAIAGTTFFIPIITPSYFRSQACRKELLKFVREAERLGLEQLLMSVYWVRVPDLEEDPEESADEAIRVIAKYNWQDLREEGLEERDSSVYRKAVAGLAAELAKRAEFARTVDDTPHFPAGAENGDDHGDEEPGIIEILAATEDAMPGAATLLQVIAGHIGAINLKLEAAAAEIHAERGQGMNAVLSLTNRLAEQLSEPAAGIRVSGHQYGEVLAALDRGVHLRLDRAKATDELAADDKEFLNEMEEAVVATHQVQEALESLLAGAEDMSTYSRSLGAPFGEMRSGLVGVRDGAAIVEEWARRAAEIRASGAEQGDAADGT